MYFVPHMIEKKKKKTYLWSDLLEILLKFLANTSPLARENLKEARDVFVKFFEEFCIQVFAWQATELCQNLKEKYDKLIFKM